MKPRLLPVCVIAVLGVVTGARPAMGQEPPDAPAEKVRLALDRAAAKVGAKFEARSGVPRTFAAALTGHLSTCDRIDVEVRVPVTGAVEVTAYPRVRGERLDARKAANPEGLLEALRAPSPEMAPLSWVADAEAEVRAGAAIDWSDGTGSAALERAVGAAPALDRQVARLLPYFRKPLGEAELKAKLAGAAKADEAGRNRILAEIASDLPEVTVSATAGKSAFVRLDMNRRGTAFDAFRFRVPAAESDRRLVWAFAYPPGTAKGWYIAPVSGDAPKLVKFHRGGTYEGSGIPAGHATLLQRSETPLRPGAEYVIWFSFKVETPVAMYVALGCVPFAKADRDSQTAIEQALGLKPH